MDDYETPAPARHLPRVRIYISSFSVKQVMLLLLLAGVLVAVGIGDSWLAVHA